VPPRRGSGGNFGGRACSVHRDIGRTEFGAAAAMRRSEPRLVAAPRSIGIEALAEDLEQDLYVNFARQCCRSATSQSADFPRQRRALRSSGAGTGF
jgi:hypothetical protein